MNILEVKKTQPYASVAIFFAVAFALYSGTFSNEWTYDDLPVIVENTDVQSIKGFLENTYPGRPLREISFLIDHAIFGLSPSGWHFQQIFWHSVNAILIWRIIPLLGGGPIASWFSALAFLIHPVQAEVVANISHRKDILALAFCLISILLYAKGIRHIKGKRAFYVAASFTSIAVAYLAKENALVMPLVLSVYELCLIPPKQRILTYYPFAYLTIATSGLISFSIWLWAGVGLQKHAETIVPLMVKFNLDPPFSEGRFFLTAIKSSTFMISKIFWPTNLAPEYTYSAPSNIFDAWVISGAFICLFIGGLGYFLFRRHPNMFFALSLFVIFWIPTSNLIWPLSYFSADRYIYAPIVGIACLLGLAIDKPLSHQSKLAFIPITVLLISLSFSSWQQCKIWRDSESLWYHAVRVNPEATFALNNIGQILIDKKEYSKAESYLLKAANLNHSVIMPRYNLALLYDLQGDRFSAIRYFSEFLQRVDFGGNREQRQLATEIRRYIFKKYGLHL